MYNSDKLREIGTLLACARPDWGRILEKYKYYQGVDSEGGLPLTEYVRRLSLIHLYVALEDIANTEEGIILNPVRKNMSSRGTTFSYSNGFFSTLGREEKTSALPGTIIEVDSNPVYVMRSFGRMPKKERGELRKQTYKRRTGAVSFRANPGNAMDICIYPEKLRHIRDVFGVNLGYVVMTQKDTYENLVNDPYYSPFFREGGILVPFPLTRREFNDRVLRTVENAGLKLVLA